MLSHLDFKIKRRFCWKTKKNPKTNTNEQKVGQENVTMVTLEKTDPPMKKNYKTESALMSVYSKLLFSRLRLCPEPFLVIDPYSKRERKL